jgi:hypothetical protein
MGNDGDGHHFESVNPAGIADAAMPHEQRKRDERGRRRQSETEPGSQSARQTGADDANPDSDLAAGRSGQKMAQRSQIGKTSVIDPLFPPHIFVIKIGQVRGRSAERGKAQLGRNGEQFQQPRHSPFFPLLAFLRHAASTPSSK